MVTRNHRNHDMKFKKTILVEGIVNTLGRNVRITGDRIKQIKDTFDRLKNKGYRVPTLYEHPSQIEDPAGWPRKDDPDLEEKVNRYKAHTGRVEELSIVDTEKGKSLVATIDIRDQDAAKRISEGLVNDCSPMVVPEYIDGDSEAHKVVMTHLALTDKPRQLDKGGFIAVLSDDVSDKDVIDLDAHFAAMGDYPKKPGMDDPEDEEEDGEDDVVGKAKGGEAEDASEDSAKDVGDEDGEDDGDVEEEIEEEAEEVDTKPKGHEEKLREVMSSLKEIGVVIPEGTTEDDFLTVLHATLLTHLSTKNGGGVGFDGNPPADETPNDEIEEVEDPMTTARMSDLEEEVTTLKRGILRGRLENLHKTGRITSDKMNALSASIDGWKMSDDEKMREALGQIEFRLGVHEELPANACVPLEQRLALGDEVDEVTPQLGVRNRVDGTRPLARIDDDKERESLIESTMRLAGFRSNQKA